MKNYKIGDRIFFECYDGTIETAIVIDIEDKSFLTDKGKEFHYKSLITWREGNCSSAIEDYNCLSKSNPKCKELAKKYAKFDKNKEKIISSLMDIIKPWDKDIQENIVDLLKIELEK